MSTSNGGGAADNAEVAVGENPPGRRLVDYHEQVAADAEQAVKNTKQTISDLEKSMKGREAEAKQHREAAKRVRAELEG